MYIVASFDHSAYLELAITELEMKGIPKEQILAIPMDAYDGNPKLFDSVHSSDGTSLFDFPAMLAVLFGVVLSIYGFVWRWGPFLWGLIGIFSGFAVGFAIKWPLSRKKSQKKNGQGPEVILLIQCPKDLMEMARKILWMNKALGVGRLDIN